MHAMVYMWRAEDNMHFLMKCGSQVLRFSGLETSTLNPLSNALFFFKWFLKFSHYEKIK